MMTRKILHILLLIVCTTGHGNDLFDTCHWGAYFVDSETGEELYSYNAKKLFIPASVTKLFTVGLAMDSLEPDHTFHTTVATSSRPNKAGVVEGHLYLIGGWDSCLTSQDLRNLAHKVHDCGIRTILGSAISVMCEDTFLPMHAEWDDLTMGYCPEICPLSINDNAVIVTLSPNESGSGLAGIKLEQDIPYFTVVNNVKTVKGIGAPEINYTRGLTDNILTISGIIPASYHPMTVKIAIHNPSEYAMRVFIKELQDCGIEIQDSLEKTSYDKNSSFEIAQHVSPPLKELICRMNKNSHNFIAEMLFKYLGGYPKGSEFLKKVGITPEDYQWFDGSGLSRHNLFAPHHVVSLLQYLNKSGYVETLPIAGVDGTLANRFLHKNPGYLIQAKTGSMSGMKNLAGSAQTPSGRNLTFAIFINNTCRSNSETIEALDNFLMNCLEHLN